MLSHLHFFFLLPLFFSAVFLFLVMNLFTRKLILLDQLTSLLMTICTDKFLLQTEMVKKKKPIGIQQYNQRSRVSIVLRDIWVACFRMISYL